MTPAFRRVSGPLVAAVLLFDGVHAGDGAATGVTQHPGVHTPGRAAMPLDFIENRGQWAERVAFVARKGRVGATFRAGAIDLQLGHADSVPLTLAFEGALSSVSLSGERRRSGQYNFYIGNDPRQWRSAVPAYASVLYDGLYPGGDLRVREQGDRLEYDLLLEPGADLGRVVIRVDGASGMRVDADGALIIDTAAGPLRQTPPTTWEILPDGGHRPVDCRFRIVDGSRYGFAAPARDGSLPLVVDPGLEWGTYLGGFGSDPITAVATARDGTADIFVAGISTSPDFPSIDDPTLGPMQNRAFVARLNSSASTLVYATFLGGWHAQLLYRGLATNTAGEAVIAGESRSPDFPTTAGAFSRSFLNGDAFVSKVDRTGALLFSTFLGGSSGEDAYAVDFDPAGGVVVGGTTTSADFPTTAGAFDTTYNVPNASSQGGFHGDMYISRLSPDGSQLTYSTFLGGPSLDALEDLVVDAQGFVTVVGWVTGNNVQVFRTTAGAFDSTWNGSQDAALARLKLDGQGSADLRYATLIGGSSQDNIFGVAVDPANPELVTVAGRTWSWDFPTTPGVFKPTNQRGSDLFPDVEDGFVVRFRFPATGGGTLLWSTYLGAPQNTELDAASDVAVGNAGEAIVVGRTGALDFPTTRGAFDRTTAGVFAARLSASGAQLLYSTFFGGTAGNIDSERISPRVAHAGGNTAVIAGATESADFPATAGAFDRTFNSEASGGSDGYVIKLALDADASGDVAADPPVLLHPAEGATIPFGTYFARLEWADVIDASGVQAYQYQLQTSPTFPPDGVVRSHYAGSVRTTDVMLPPLPDAGLALSTWYWRVRTADRAGNFSAWSLPRSFRVSDTDGGFSVGVIGVDPQKVVGGNPATGTVYFTAPAPAGAGPVKLSIHKSRLQQFIGERPMPTVPETVSIPAGATQVSFPISTPHVLVSTPVDIFATVDGLGRIGGFTVNPPAAVTAQSISVTPISVTGGTASTGTLTLSGAAPPGGATFPLSSTHPQAATVPATVTVPAGATSATFPITTVPVTTAIDAQIAATPPGIWLPAVLKVRPPTGISLTSLVLSSSSVTSGTQVTATVTLSGPVPPTPWPASPDAIIALSTSDRNLVGLSPMVFVPAGASSTTFTFTPTSPAQTTTVQIRAAFDGTTLTAPVTISPGGAAAVASIFLEGTIQGGFGGIGNVRLAAPAPAGGVVVSLSNTNPAVLSIPRTVTIGSGSTTGSFAYTATTVTTATAVTAGASYGSSSASLTVTVTPATARSPLQSLSVSPSTVAGGSSATGTATLQNPARAGGVIVQLSTSNSSVATVPSSITVPAGASSATFAVNTSPVATTTGIVISGLGDNTGLHQTTGLTVTPGGPAPATLSGISLNPASVVGGNGTTGTVTLTGAAPAGGLSVALADNSTAASTPVNATVPAGATSASFTIGTSPVATTTTATITATVGATTRSASLTIAASGGGGGGPAGFLGPTANAPDTGGDGNGFQTNPSNVHTADGAVATDTNSGSGTSTSCTNTGKDRHRFFDFGLAIPAGSSVAGIEVRLDARADSTSGAPRMCVQLSWNGGTTWTAAKTTSTLGTTLAAFTLGGAADTWGRTWSAADLTNANFRLRVIDVASSTSRDFFLDWIGVRLHTAAAGPVALNAVGVSPSSVTGGTSAQGTVTLTGAAPADGAAISLSSSNPAVVGVPASTTIAAGATSATFAVTSSTVTANTSATVTATYNGTSRTAAITITPEPPPASLQGVSVSPASVTGGTSAQGTVTLTGAAPAGGAAVSLTSSNPAVAAVPASTTIAAGATSAPFTAATSTVTAATTVTISAAHNGVTRTAALTVNPAASQGSTTLTVTATGRSGERVTSSPAGISVNVGTSGSASFAAGTSITLSVSNGRDAIWSGACSSGGNKQRSCTFTLNGTASVTANVQ